MIVQVEFLDENGKPLERGELGDRVIRAIDRAMNGASWGANGNGWVAMK